MDGSPSREAPSVGGLDAARSRAGWILVAGLALVVLGLVGESGRAATPQTTGTQGGGTGVQATSSLPPISSGYGTADSNGQMIAVTGIDVTGGSLLYVIDTQAKQLAVYQAQGGTSSTMNVKFVGGRRIDLDLQVYGFNDESDYSYEELKKEFDRAGSSSLPQKQDH